MKFHKRPDCGEFQIKRRMHQVTAIAERRMREGYWFLNKGRRTKPLDVLDGLLAEADEAQRAVIVLRNHHAAQWRKVRARFYALPLSVRQEIRRRAAQYTLPLTTIAYTFFIQEVTKQQ